MKRKPKLTVEINTEINIICIHETDFYKMISMKENSGFLQLKILQEEFYAPIYCYDNK